MNKKIQLLALAGLCLLLVTSPASAADFSLFGSLYDSEDLDESFGGGVRVSFPVAARLDIELTVSYYEEFENRFEDREDLTKVNVQTIPTDLGLTYFLRDNGGFFFGGGVTWGFLDVQDFELNGVRPFSDADADDEFGVFAKVGYQFAGGFFAEFMWRDLDVSVEHAQFDPNFPELRDLDLDMGGYVTNIGWRFGGRGD